MDDNDGELLPDLLIADVCRWVGANRNPRAGQMQELLGWLQDRFEIVRAGADGVDNVMAVSFIEDLPAPGNPTRT